MDGLLLLCCVEILLCGAQRLHAGSPTAYSPDGADRDQAIPTSLTFPPSVSGPKPAAGSLTDPQPPTSILRFSGGPSVSPLDESQLTSLLDGFLYRKECIPVLMVSGGLFIACSILLVSTLFLAWKVGQLSRRMEALTDGTGLTGRMGSSKSKKSKSAAAPEEVAVIMDECKTRQEEASDGAAAGEGEAASESAKEKAEDVSTTPAAAASESASSTEPLEAAEGLGGAEVPTPQEAQDTKEAARDELE